MIRPALVSASRQFSRGFRSFAPAYVKAGDAVPSIDINEGSPGNSVNLANETANVSSASFSCSNAIARPSMLTH